MTKKKLKKEESVSPEKPVLEEVSEEIIENKEEPIVEEKPVSKDNSTDRKTYMTVFEYCSSKGIKSTIAAGINVVEKKKDNTAENWERIYEAFSRWDMVKPWKEHVKDYLQSGL